VQELILLALAMLLSGCVAGVFAGLLGVGGGIVIVPVMEAALSFVGVDPSIRMHISVATSLAVIIPTSISSARAHYARAAVDVALVRRWALPILVGALLGSLIAGQVHSRVLSAVFGFFALLIGLKMIFHANDKALRDDVPAGALMSTVPAAIGFFSSMMGIGGGTFSVTVLTLCGRPIHQAVGTSALFGLFIALPATAGFIVGGWGNPLLPPASLGYVSLVGFLFIAPATVLAAPVGARIAHGLSRDRLNQVFGVFLLIAAIRMWSRTLG